MDGMIKVSDNFDEGARLFDRIARKAGNTVGLMKAIAGIMHHEVEENFANEGRPNKWKPLAQSTIRARRKKGNWPGKILQVRGRLATSFQTDYDNNKAVCGTNVIYAAIQHFGGTTKHAARMRILHFGDTHAARMGKDRYGPGRATRSFAKPGKATFGMKVPGHAYSATIPARPILYISQGGLQKMLDAGKAWLRSA
ncbi:MAG: phage virion morphogenesis protein [Desulfobacteraceae bacterium]|nr:phage virion morphogenesis protein [Desulfobacteraceae bacterium]